MLILTDVRRYIEGDEEFDVWTNDNFTDIKKNIGKHALYLVANAMSQFIRISQYVYVCMTERKRECVSVCRRACMCALSAKTDVLRRETYHSTPLPSKISPSSILRNLPP